MDWTEAIQNKRLFVVDYDLKHEGPIHTLHLTLDGAKRQALEFIEEQGEKWTLITEWTWEHERGRDRIEISDSPVGE